MKKEVRKEYNKQYYKNMPRWQRNKYVLAQKMKRKIISDHKTQLRIDRLRIKDKNLLKGR